MGLAIPGGRRVTPQLLVALQEVITGGAANSAAPSVGLYRSGPEIVRFFKRCGYPDTYENWSRVSHTDEVLDGIYRLWDGDNRILEIAQEAVNPLDYQGKEEKLSNAIAHLNRKLTPSGIELKHSGNNVRLIDATPVMSASDNLREIVDILSFDGCKREFDRALSGIQSDPAASITAASSTLESVAKTILQRRGHTLPSQQTVGKLVHAAFDALGLAPNLQDDGDMKRLLGGLINSVEAIGAIRTKSGTAHGRGDGHIEADRDLAEVCVNSSLVLSLFMLRRFSRTS